MYRYGNKVEKVELVESEKNNIFAEKTVINQFYCCLSCENGVFLVNCVKLANLYIKVYRIRRET